MSTPAHDVSAYVAKTLSLQQWQVDAVIKLLDDKSTVPFIARYRKEQTGSLDEVQIRLVQTTMEQKRDLEKRRTSILSSLEEQGINDKKLISSIQQAQDLTRLEDLYAPYRPRRMTRAQKAIEAGLDKAADLVSRDLSDASSQFKKFVCEQYPDTDAVRQGVVDIFAEKIADDAHVRDFLRQKFERYSVLESKKKRGAEEDPKYSIYIDFSIKNSYLKPHQTLAIRRGEKEGVLSVKIPGEQERWCQDVQRREVNFRNRANREILNDAVEESYKRLLQPQLERELRAQLESDADQHAINIFALNLKNLLLSPPLPGRKVMGLDPGLRTGCKLAIVDDQGNVLTTDTLYLHDQRVHQAHQKLETLLNKYGVQLVAIGNGTGTHEAQQAMAHVIQNWSRDNEVQDVRYAVVDEAGASVYSASDLARQEMPDLDVSLRGAVSIARRLQDPLAELIKIDPKSVGVGMYQHDVNQTTLSKTLDAVVEDVVNSVGVDLNTASPALLAHIAGVGPKLASNIVEHRASNGLFRTRKQLQDIKGLGAKTFEQCAGFLRVRNGEDPLDNTGIHPESYKLARALKQALERASLPPQAWQREVERGQFDELAKKHGFGRPTLLDIVAHLNRPGRDPREDLDPPDLRQKLLTMDDLVEGMKVSGTVRNVVDFGAFVDIGVKQDGLVHISKMATSRVHNPYEVVSVGDRVDVTVMEIDRKRGRISLSMI